MGAKAGMRRAAGGGGSLLAAAAILLLPGQGNAELIQEGTVRVAVSASLSPTKLPRKGKAPVKVQIGGRITSTGPGGPPQLKRVTFAFNRAGQMQNRGLPKCRLGHINPSTTREALLNCRRSLIGEGSFSANVKFPEQSPFPSVGKVLAFNGVLRGEPVIFAHIYGTKPVPTSYVLPLEIRKAKGTFTTILTGSLPLATGDWGYVTGLRLKLGRTFSSRGKRRSFLSAGCPAPKGFPGIPLFPFARASFSFEGGRTLKTTINRNCRARG